MKTVKLKAGTAITLAHQQAPVGVTPSGVVIFEVVNVPDDVSISDVRLRFNAVFQPYLGNQLTYDYETQQAIANL